MSDEEQIRRTLAEFCRFLDGRRFEEWANLFCEDGVFNDLVGREAILGDIRIGSLARNPELRRKHTNPNIIIDVDGDRAEVTCDLVMFDRIGDGPHTIRIGEYHDFLVRSGERWLFESRQLTTDRKDRGTKKP